MDQGTLRSLLKEAVRETVYVALGITLVGEGLGILAPTHGGRPAWEGS